ncbi:hypothetical protein [Candidatus Electronema sp. PJ]|uniref:hypothetical protein n=1 Tax=Candidatus Electronema sp. PJ TaxID=3401572 RepID=UPI003AA8D9A9
MRLKRRANRFLLRRCFLRNPELILLSCSLAKQFYSAEEEFCRLGKELESAEKEFGRVAKESGQAAEEFCRLAKKFESAKLLC